MIMEYPIIKIALLGLGTVGGGVYEIIRRQKEEIPHKLKAMLEISHILVRNKEKAAARVSDPSVITTEWSDIIHDPDVQIVVEVMGGIEPAATYIKEALRAGKHVVTANKDLIAEQSADLLKIAQQYGVDLLFEAAVAGGIPIISPLKGSLLANEITEITGIVNGTTNYILSKMTEEKMNFEDALSLAKQLGYAEADPTADIEGLDAGRKMAIMASLAFHTPVTFSDVYTEGITRIKARDINYAEEFGHVVKLMGVAKNDGEGIEVRVHPLLVPKGHPLAAVSGPFNAVFVHGDAVDDVMFYGRGAGDLPTGSAILGDVFEIARGIAEGRTGSATDMCYRQLPVRTIDEVISRYYLRMEVEDKPGVLATIASVLGNNAVSIEQMVQKAKVGSHAELVVITDRVRERHMRDAMLTFAGLSVVKADTMLIRVYG